MEIAISVIAIVVAVVALAFYFKVKEEKEVKGRQVDAMLVALKATIGQVVDIAGILGEQALAAHYKDNRIALLLAREKQITLYHCLCDKYVDLGGKVGDLPQPEEICIEEVQKRLGNRIDEVTPITWVK